MNDCLIARHLTVMGHVQGVAFRASMVVEARRLGVVGWVRNRADGSVEALVQGAEAPVQTLIAWARHGPARAQVTSVEMHAAPLASCVSFERRETV